LRHIAGIGAIGRQLVRPVLTIGNFDGVHLGHRAIVDTVVERARSHQGESVVFTFEPHPRRVLQPEAAPRMLTTLEQKLELLEAGGIDAVIVEEFTAEYARTPAEAFIRDTIYRQIRPREVYVGYDFHFGRDREGSMRMLTELGPRLGFSVTVIPEVLIEEGDVNSTRIRKLLSDGDAEKAALMLGRPYAVRGQIVEGDHRGRTLGFPTANLEPENEILPSSGVYAGRIRFLDDGDPARGSEIPAVVNVGTRPTFEGDGSIHVEAHLIDWSGDAYGRRVDLGFLGFLRGERRFPDPDALKARIAQDVVDARKRLESP
jgi:riboflavin kinase/FMN adenylyltransferase